jgi:sugar lactone lactonase YvrE
MSHVHSQTEEEPHCIWDVAAELGEGPVWVAREKAIYFVDIKGNAVHCWQVGGKTRSWTTPSEPGFVLPYHRGGLVCGLRGGLHHFDPSTGVFALLVPVEKDKPHHRINDGFVDASGRIWFGTMNDDGQTVGGALYSSERDMPLRVNDTGYIVTNGPVTSPDARRLYHTDSITRTVYAFDLSEAGVLSSKRPFIQFPEGLYPDGMAMDETGNLWIAVFNGWRIEKYSPQGKKLSEIRFPCANVTKPAFGGDDLRALYVTTAWIGLTAESRAKQPLAGGLFAVNLETPGLKLREASCDLHII